MFTRSHGNNVAFYNKLWVHLLIPSCGRGAFDLEINMIGLAMKMLQKVKKHIFVTNFIKFALTLAM
jgi:hypothetical protein